MPCPNDYQTIASYEIWEEMVLFHIGKRMFKIKKIVYGKLSIVYFSFFEYQNIS
jgi:hypothetical protein